MSVPPEHPDVVVVGAGISGISAAYHLQTMCPDREFASSRDGRHRGTWDLFRYPGVRSDSDMHTLGFKFKPWSNPKAIADGPSILDYLNETVDEFGIRSDPIHHRISNAHWSWSDRRRTLTVDHGDDVRDHNQLRVHVHRVLPYRGASPRVRRRLHVWRPDHPLPGMARRSRLRREAVAVIGSGAPHDQPGDRPGRARNHGAAHTDLGRVCAVAGSDRERPSGAAQRPGVRTHPPEEPALRRVRVSPDPHQPRPGPSTTAERARQAPAAGTDRRPLHAVVQPMGPAGLSRARRRPVRAINAGKADVVTDIDRFTETGLQLDSGTHIDADIIVTATGLNLVTIGDMDFDIDGEKLDFSETWTYKGVAYSGIPNLISVFGYINASWTLRADLLVEYGCRLLNHLRDTGTSTATPRLRPSDATMPRRPFIADFPAGYMQRMMPMLPKQGDREPWVNTQSVSKDRKLIAEAPVDDGVMVFS